MKYGFVYIWLDRKHKRYYIGCHWGSTDDSYICSSPWMLSAYKRRPQDFKRRILKSNILSRKELFEEEHRWLKMTKPSELRIRYYNIKYFDPNYHWSADERKYKSVSRKLSEARTGVINGVKTRFKKGERRSPDTEFAKGRVAHNKGKTMEERYGVERAVIIKEKNRQSHLGKVGSPSSFKKGHIPWNAKYEMIKGSKV